MNHSKCCSMAATRSAFFFPSAWRFLSLIHSERTATVNYACQYVHMFGLHTDLAQCSIVIVLPHRLVRESLRLLHSLGLLDVIVITRTLYGSTRKTAHGEV